MTNHTTPAITQYAATSISSSSNRCAVAVMARMRSLARTVSIRKALLVSRAEIIIALLPCHES